MRHSQRRKRRFERREVLLRRVSTLTAAMSLTAALALTATACGESSTESSDGGEKGPGIAFDVGGRDDHSFNEAAARGADKAEKELGVKPNYQTAQNGETDADRIQRLSTLARKGYNPVIGVGFLYGESIKKVAKQYPDTTFGVVDSVVDVKNVYSMVFAEHEGSYLAGVAAAHKTKTGKVGFIGGVNNALIQKFQAGFEQGVKDSGKDVKVVSQFLYATDDKGFNDPAKAKEQANGMLSRNVDVIYTAAGQSGSGAIEEIAKKENAWAIGVDSDQYQQPGLKKYRDAILTSVVKNVDVAVYDLIKSVKDGEPLTGVGEYTLKKDGVSLSTSGGFIEDIRDEIEAAREKVASGEVKVKEKP